MTTNKQYDQASVTGYVFIAKTPEVSSYDADGNLTNDGRWGYARDAENRSVRMQAKGIRFGQIRFPLAKFRYDADSKTVSEFDRRFWGDFGRVQDAYLKINLRGPSRESCRTVMKWLSRSQLHLLRAITRGLVIPFQGIVLASARSKAMQPSQ